MCKINNTGINVTDIAEINVSASVEPEFKICSKWQILYVISGTIHITVNGSAYKIGQQKLVILSTEDFYCILDSEEAKFSTISFNCSGNLLEKITGGVFSISEIERHLIDELRTLASDSEQEIAYHQIKVMLELVLLRSTAKLPILPNSEDKEALLLKRAIQILQKNVTVKLSTVTIAEKLGISLSSLKRMFSKYTKIGIHEYFLYLKISEAKKYLLAGETVTYTSQLLGFSNQAYFSTVFKRIVGVSPKEFSAKGEAEQTNKVKRSYKKIQDKEMPSYLL